jgi:hypothetical protein
MVIDREVNQGEDGSALWRHSDSNADNEFYLGLVSVRWLSHSHSDLNSQWFCCQ